VSNSSRGSLKIHFQRSRAAAGPYCASMAICIDQQWTPWRICTRPWLSADTASLTITAHTRPANGLYMSTATGTKSQSPSPRSIGRGSTGGERRDRTSQAQWSYRAEPAPARPRPRCIHGVDLGPQLDEYRLHHQLDLSERCFIGIGLARRHGGTASSSSDRWVPEILNLRRPTSWVKNSHTGGAP
jgi:hypothetical protein